MPSKAIIRPEFLRKDGKVSVRKIVNALRQLELPKGVHVDWQPSSAPTGYGVLKNEKGMVFLFKITLQEWRGDLRLRCKPEFNWYAHKDLRCLADTAARVEKLLFGRRPSTPVSTR